MPKSHPDLRTPKAINLLPIEDQMKAAWEKMMAVDKSTGEMKYYGHWRWLDLIVGYFRVDDPYCQGFHTDDRNGMIRAQLLGDYLLPYSYKVGYVVIVPLMLSGTIFSVLLKETDDNGNVMKDSNDKDIYKIYDLDIPFGTCLLIRLDLWHAGFAGFKGGW